MTHLNMGITKPMAKMQAKRYVQSILLVSQKRRLVSLSSSSENTHAGEENISANANAAM